MTTGQPKRIAIVGAGIMGRCLAWRLLQGFNQTAGKNTDIPELHIFDKDPIKTGQAAAYTAAGMLAPFSELEAAETSIFQLGQFSLTIWQQWLAEWQAQNCYQACGTLVVAHRQDIASLERFNRQLQASLETQPEQAHLVRSLQAKELQDLEPGLSPQFQNASYLSAEACLDNQGVMTVMAEQLQNHGVVWHSGVAIKKLGPGWLERDEQILPFDCVFDCRGMGAKQAMPGLRGVRGEIIRVQAKDVKLHHMVRLMHPRYRLYLVPKPNHEYVLGATQIEAEDYSPVSVRSSLELLSALYAIHPGFAEARVLASLSNCRPALADNQPLIKTQAGLVELNGLYRHGFLLAPALAEICANNFLAEGNLTPDLQALADQIVRSVNTGPSGLSVKHNENLQRNKQ